VLKDVLRTKSIARILETANGHDALKRHLGPFQLTLLGIGAIIGAGIFSAVGSAAAGGADHLGAGPALILSFVITAITCGFAALCYAEFASMVPISGSAYTYAYATLGEIIAWIIGWDLIIEYAVGNVAVAISWSGYFQELLRVVGLGMPDWLGLDYRSAAQAAEQVKAAMAQGPEALAALSAATIRAGEAFGHAPQPFGFPLVFNLPAFAIVSIITVILVLGIRESAWFNTSMVALKLVIIAFFVIFGAFFVEPENWKPFAPNGTMGIFSAAAIIFFAYIGFDAVSTASEEAKNPKRDMPIAIIASLVICTIIYVLVAVVLTGMLPWTELGTAEPLATAFSGRGMTWPTLIVALGAVFATTSVLLVFQLGQPRIFFSMARDGLLPKWAASVHPRFRTPYKTTILTGAFVAVLASVANIDEIVQLTNIGTLFAFVLVCIGVTVLRLQEPDRERPFKVPLGPYLLPALGVISCVFLMIHLPPASWWRFVGWLVLGMALYFAFGYNHSAVGRAHGRPHTPTAMQRVVGFGFFLAGVGLFVIPHDAGPSELMALSRGGDMRAATGLMMIALGAIAAIVGGFRMGGRSDAALPRG
jgi:APA family basic amino acid/polyamine antiporter